MLAPNVNACLQNTPETSDHKHVLGEILNVAERARQIPERNIELTG
jgi:hypothetical protein